MDSSFGYNFFHSVQGCTLACAKLLGVGYLLLGCNAPGCGLLAVSSSYVAALFYSLNRGGWSIWR